MNIFILDEDPKKIARAYVDSHMKIILEIAQMMSQALHEHPPKDFDPSTVYRSMKSHRNHPCTLWVGASLSNWKWARTLARYLNEENRKRYGKDHKSWLLIKEMAVPRIKDKGLTAFAQCMPVQYQVPGDAVTAYRNQYCGQKTHLFRWKTEQPPDWLLAHHRMMCTPSLI